MMNENEKRADLASRTLLVHAQYADMKPTADKEDIIVDLLASLWHLNQHYSYNLDELHQQAKIRFLENFLRQAKEDQGGEASFEDWINYTADTIAEHGHPEAKEYLSLKGDLSEKNKNQSGEWVANYLNFFR